MTTDPILIRPIRELELSAIAPLVEESEHEGHAFVARLREDWLSGENRFDRPREVLLGAYRDGRLVGVCGLNKDPYVADPSVGRVRHLYVLCSERRKGTGTRLVRAVISTARGRFVRLDLRTGSREAASFYTSCGFVKVGSPTATHRMVLDVGGYAESAPPERNELESGHIGEGGETHPARGGVAEPARGRVDVTAHRFENWIDAHIREAEARGQFADLPGRGQPIEDLSDDPDWWVKAKLRREGLSFVPDALRLRREVEQWRDRLATIGSEAAVRNEVFELNDKIRQANSRMTSGPPSNLVPLDVDAEVDRWRGSRPVE